MADVVLPAGATIAAFVMSVISWYGMLRAGYQALYFDTHTRKHVSADKISIMEGLDQQEKRFKDFQKRWLIFSPTLPQELYTKLWGSDACTKIQTLFQNITERSGHITEKVHSWQLSSQIEVDREKKKEKKKHLPFSSFKTAWGKTNFVAAQKLYLEECLKRLTTDIEYLENAAKRGYQETQGLPGNRNDVNEEEIHSLIIGYLLVDLANRWRGDVESFADSLLQIRPDFFVELELSQISGTTPSQRHGHGNATKVAQAIAVVQTATVARLKLTMLAGTKVRQNMNPVRISVETLPDPPSTFHPDSYAAFQELLQNIASCDYSADNNTHIRIAKASATHPANDGFRLPLRTIPSPHHDPPAFFRCKRREEELSKYRAVFELSQTYLMFLRTKWLRSLCSCHVRYGKIRNYSDYEFSLSMADDQHMSHPTADAHEPHPWCQKTRPISLDSNLCLGILLAEITLGVYVIPNNNPFGERRVLVQAGQQGDQKIPCTFGELRKRLRDIGDEERHRGAIPRTADYADAIMYCFENRAPELAPAGGTKNPLGEFYLNVVAKLREYYFTIERQIREPNRSLDMFPN